MNVRLAVAASVAVVSLTACATQEDVAESDGTWVGTITTEGNVTTVVNESGSVWSGPATLVEEASIGVESGEDPYMFGFLVEVVASGERIYVLDRQVPILRMYDLDGRHLGNVGGVGSGPGEYREPDAIGIADDGRLFVRDAADGRVLVYSPEGTVLETWAPQLSFRNYLLAPAVTGDGRYFEPVIQRADEIMDEKWGMQQFSAEGAVGSPIPVPEGAARAAERRVVDRFRESFPDWRWDGPPIPDTMPAFYLLFPDRDGRIWVQRIVGTRRDPNCDPEERGRECWPGIVVLEVFGPDGRYMGAVEAPSSYPLGSPRFISGGTIVVTTSDAAGTIMVKRYRLVLPGERVRNEIARDYAYAVNNPPPDGYTLALGERGTVPAIWRSTGDDPPEPYTEALRRRERP